MPTNGYYIYLICSLPALEFGMKPPFSFNAFLRLCEDKIPADDIESLRRVSRRGDYSYSSALQPTLRQWYIFDTTLRNELVRIRAERKKDNPLKYIRRPCRTEPALERLALNAYKNPALLDAERMLDRYRWERLSELAQGHYFDIDFLIVYALKLLILERWERIRCAKPEAALEDVLKKEL